MHGEKKNETDDQEAPHETEFGEILKKAKCGEKSAIAQLFDQSQKYLLLIANQNLDPAMLQKFGASDMVQQSMLIANQKIDGFQGQSRGEYLAWIRQILIHECQQATRSYRQTDKRNVNRERSLTNSASEHQQPQVKDDFLTPSSEAVSNEEIKALDSILKTIPEIDQQVIKMRNWEELSFEEIGRAIDKSAEAARKIWSRAIMKLESELRKQNLS
jgi:RNA polymerase sigma-70 factor (subfamily 1)